MDLSLYRAEKPIYKHIQEILNIPVGTVLAYIPFSKENGLEWSECRDYLTPYGDKSTKKMLILWLSFFWCVSLQEKSDTAQTI